MVSIGVNIPQEGYSMSANSLIARLAIVVMLALFPVVSAAEQRNEYSRIRVPPYLEFYKNYNTLYRIGALANYWNLHIYDVLLTRPDPTYVEGDYYNRLKALALGDRIRLDPNTETAAPIFARLAWGVGESFIWTHSLHEAAFDAYADTSITQEERHRMVERATDEYLRNPRALTPVSISMERIHQMPYHGAFARKYPKTIGLIWAGHWFHGGVYEGQIAVIRGQQTIEQTEERVEAEFERLTLNPPGEHPHFTHIAPEFTMLHPRAAGIFANMHMLHDMVADILADERVTDKRQAIYEARSLMLASREPEETGGGIHHGH
jgi:hypothetical protein